MQPPTITREDEPSDVAITNVHRPLPEGAANAAMAQATRSYLNRRAQQDAPPPAWIQHQGSELLRTMGSMCHNKVCPFTQQKRHHVQRLRTFRKGWLRHMVSPSPISQRHVGLHMLQDRIRDVFLMKTKYQSSGNANIIPQVDQDANRVTKYIRCVSDHVFKGDEFNEVAHSNNADVSYSAPYTPTQNTSQERRGNHRTTHTSNAAHRMPTHELLGFHCCVNKKLHHQPDLPQWHRRCTKHAYKRPLP